MPFKPNAKKTGFTLVELMITLTITIIVAASLVPLITFVSSSSVSNQSKMTANHLASSVMEEIRAMKYEDIGLVSGNPAGNIPPLKENIEFNGSKFNVETSINWGSAAGKDGKTDYTAYKNARIIVKGINPRTGKLEKMAEINSVISQDGEKPLSIKGNIRTRIVDSSNLSVKDPVHVEIISPVTQKLVTDYSGSAVFAGLNPGTYKIRAKIEDGFMAAPFETVQDGWMIKDNVTVTDYNTTNIQFKMEKKTDTLAIQFIDSKTRNVITKSGNASLEVSIDGTVYPVYTNKPFTSASFTEGFLPKEFSGKLWPNGIYNIKVSGIEKYRDYNMSITQDALLDDGITKWTGQFTTDNDLSIIIPLASKFLYNEDMKDDFDDYSETENVVIRDDGSVVLEKESEKVTTVINPTSSAPGEKIDNIFDGKYNSSWKSSATPTESNPQWIRFEFQNPIEIKSVKVYLSHSGSTTQRAKDYVILTSSIINKWQNEQPGTFPKTGDYDEIIFEPPLVCKYFELKITSEWGNTSQGIRIYEVEVYTGASYKDSGYRLSKPIPLSQYSFAPRIFMEWQADVPPNTIFEVWTAVTDSTTKPKAGAFRKAENGGLVPGISPGENLEGKYLWIRENFYTNDDTQTPVLHALRIYEE